MLKKIYTLGFYCAMTFSTLTAQNKLFTLDEVVAGRKLAPQDLAQQSWYKDHYLYVENATDLIKVQAATGKKEVFLNLQTLNTALEGKAEKLTAFPDIQWWNDDECYFLHENSVWTYHIKQKQAKKITSHPAEVQHTDLAKDLKIAYVYKDNLFIAQGENTIQITKDGSSDLVYGQSVHRNEFGIEKGTFWSSDSKKLAFYRMNQSMVKEYPLVDFMVRPAVVNSIKYPMAGENSHHVTIGVFDTETKKTVYLETGEPQEQYLTNITWSPDHKSIYVAILNRGQNEMKLNQYDAISGKFIKTLFEEKHPKYVEPEKPIIFVKNNPNQFVWLSERDGYKHLYLYDAQGQLIRQLTSGNWLITEFLGFDEAGKKAFFMRTGDNPIERHFAYTELATGKVTTITTDKGTHHISLSPNADYALDTYSNAQTPRVIQLYDLKKGKLMRKELTAPNPLADFKMPEMSLVTLKAKDGTDLFGRIIKPIDFDPNKKYPVMVYVYGGPHAQLVTEDWRLGADYYSIYMAQQGYVVFTLDNRGSADRGLAFEQAIFRQLGVAETEDQLVGIDYLKSLPYVNTEKMGVFGWSFGGFMATNLMLRYPDLFKVCVAGGAVIDWKYYEIMYGERYMDSPTENPEGYQQTNLLNYVKNLKGKYLMIHGLQDDVVVPQHSNIFVQQCIKDKKVIDTFYYPTHPHNVRGKDRAHLYLKITDYMNTFLKD